MKMKVIFPLFLLTAFTPAFARSSTDAMGAGIGIVAGLLIAAVVGAVIGWLASLIVKGSGSGLFTDVLIGIGGSLIASRLFPAIGMHMGGGALGAFLSALFGAVILLLIIKLIRRG